MNLDYYVEFAVEDVAQTSQIPAEQPPFVGSEATQILLKNDANVAYTRTSKVRPPDEFDLDIQPISSSATVGIVAHGWSNPNSTCGTCRPTCHPTCWCHPVTVHGDCGTALCRISELNSPQCGPSQIQGACCTPGQPSDGANR
jgi:hypothetical protein